MNVDSIFQDLASLPRWVPYRLVYNPKREKFDKIPHTGKRGLSTAKPDDWCSLIDALGASKSASLSGVGIVMSGGIEADGWTLMGMDYDDVDFENFVTPAKTYAEKSPSGVGVRAFAWVPTTWAKKYRDTLDAHPPHCNHAEFYVGSSARFLTLTFDQLNQHPIAQLIGIDLISFEKMLNPSEVFIAPLIIPEGEGTPVHLEGYGLTNDQHLLVKGRGNLDRSATLHGLLIKLIDGDAPYEDVVATVLKVPALWQFCLEHRHNNSARAMAFARQEVERAYKKSNTYKRKALVGFNSDWAERHCETKRIINPKLEDLNFPMELFSRAPGLVGEIARWIIKSSYAPREEFAYACALSMAACLIGPYCTQGKREGKLNLYMTLVGETGTGKNEAIDVMALLLAQTEAKDCILDFPASEAGLRRQLNVSPNVLLRVDELAHKLESMHGSSNGSSMGRAVLEAYNGARMPPKVYSEEKKSLPAVENPFVQILGGTTDKVWDVVRSSHMEDGTLNRFLFICLPDRPPYRHNFDPSSAVEKEFKDRLNAFWRDGRRFDLLGYVPPGSGRKLIYDDDVAKEINTLDHVAWELQRQDYGSLYSRYTQNTLKVAGILAAGDGRLNVTMTDFTQAKRFIEWSISNTYARISVRMADTNFERLTKRLKEKLEKNDGKLGMREAYKSMHISRREMEELTATMILSGEIEVVKENEQKGGYYPEWIILI